MVVYTTADETDPVGRVFSAIELRRLNIALPVIVQSKTQKT
jgi:hypothetical protein